MRYIVVKQSDLYPGVEAVSKYVAYCTRHADPKSEFGKKTENIRQLKDDEILLALIAMGYDGLVFLKDEADVVVGHVFCQWRKGVPYMFSIAVDPRYQSQGHSRRMAKFFLQYVRTYGARVLRFGAGNVRKQLTEENWERFNKLYERIVSNRLEKLGFRVEAIRNRGYGWVRILI